MASVSFGRKYFVGLAGRLHKPRDLTVMGPRKQ
jgi:hypothetical protein